VQPSARDWLYRPQQNEGWKSRGTKRETEKDKGGERKGKREDERARRERETEAAGLVSFYFTRGI
jgi:hypothetical protein